MEMFMASDYLKIIDYLEENHSKIYVSKYILNAYKREKTLLRYLLFHNNLIAFGKMEKGKLVKLIIIENNQSLLQNTNSLKVMACSLNKKDINVVFEQMRDIYSNLMSFKIFTNNSEYKLPLDNFDLMGFENEATIKIKYDEYYDFGVSYAENH